MNQIKVIFNKLTVTSIIYKCWNYIITIFDFKTKVIGNLLLLYFIYNNY